MDALKPEHWLTIAQITTTIVFAIAATIIGILSWLANYRRNVGWKPMAIVTGSLAGLRDESGSPSSIDLYFEFWNRRTYPVVIKSAAVNCGEIPFILRAEGDEKAFFKAILVKTNEHIEFRADAFIPEEGPVAKNYEVTIEVTYFDPIKRKAFDVVVRERFDD